MNCISFFSTHFLLFHVSLLHIFSTCHVYRFFPVPFVCLAVSIQTKCSFCNRLLFSFSSLIATSMWLTLQHAQKLERKSFLGLNQPFIIFVLHAKRERARAEWKKRKKRKDCGKKCFSMIKITEGVSRFLFNNLKPAATTTTDAALRKRRPCVYNSFNFILDNFIHQLTSIMRWKLTLDGILTSMYTSLLGLKVLLTICSEILMCGIEWRRWMIKDFSICMMTALYTAFSLSLWYADTQSRGGREKLLLLGSFKIRVHNFEEHICVITLCTGTSNTVLLLSYKRYTEHYALLWLFLGMAFLFLFHNIHSDVIFFHSLFQTHPKDLFLNFDLKRDPREIFYFSMTF